VTADDTTRAIDLAIDLPSGYDGDLAWEIGEAGPMGHDDDEIPVR
jgi:hypothetical protein